MEVFINVIGKDPKVQNKINDMLDKDNNHLKTNRKKDMIV